MMRIDAIRSRKTYSILLNGESVTSQLWYSLCQDIYQSALNQLDADVEFIYERSKNSNLEPFHWCLTYDIQREDGIKDTVLGYFILGLTDRFLKDGKVEICFNYYPGRVLLKKLSKLSNTKISVNSRPFGFFREALRDNFGPLSVFKRFFFIAVGNLIHKNNLNTKIKGHAIFTNMDTTHSRWKGYPESLVQKGIQGFYIDVKMNRISFLNEPNVPCSLKVFNMQGLSKSILRSFNLIRERKLFYSDENSLLALELKSQSFLQTLIVFWRFEAWNCLFKTNNVTDVHVMTTFGDPFKRLPLAAARAFGARGHIFASRPFISEFRSEDRLIDADFAERSICKIPESITVLDEYSCDKLKSKGVEAKVHIHQLTERTFTYEKGLLLLFADTDFNSKLISLVEKLDKIPLNLFFREHPLVKLDPEQLKKIDDLGDSVINLNNYRWDELQFKNVLTFSVKSTSGIDAMNCGCDLLWLPFLSQNFLLFSGYATDLGEVIFTEEEWMDRVNKFLKSY